MTLNMTKSTRVSWCCQQVDHLLNFIVDTMGRFYFIKVLYCVEQNLIIEFELIHVPKSHSCPAWHIPLVM